VRAAGQSTQSEGSDCDLLHQTRDFPQLRLYQDGEATPVSDLMARENHSFTIAPHADVDADIDWRLPVFAAGKYLLAFDGAALLLLELWRRALQALDADPSSV
jgi:hypothetical protein